MQKNKFQMERLIKDLKKDDRSCDYTVGVDVKISPAFLSQMTSTCLEFCSRYWVRSLRSSVWLVAFVVSLNVDASTKKATMKISEYKLKL